MNKILTFARKNSIPAQVVTTSTGLQAVSIPADLPGVADLLAGFCRRSGGRYTMEHRNQAAVWVWLASDRAKQQRISAQQQAAQDLFFAARRPDLHKVADYAARCKALGLDPDACARLGVGAVGCCLSPYGESGLKWH